VYNGVKLTSRGEQFATGGVAGDESSQTGIGGPQGRADAVKELCDSHFTGDEGVPHDRLVGMAVGKLGMNVEEAENSIQKSKNQGELIELPGGGYAPK
jgi:hypothetical protein